jgi:hypothetical protein
MMMEMNRYVCTVEITGAYLNADMRSVKVHMRLDKRMTDLLTSLDRSYNRYVNTDGTLVVVLDKAFMVAWKPLDYGTSV